ncbi:uncharacterized protein [Dermacentor albipictus]|uniref:uncharacterized protein isoform X2 n=1 Tax=Dermacentor albipictus TaxID=60249 RepID=UPI0038FC2B6D
MELGPRAVFVPFPASPAHPGVRGSDYRASPGVDRRPPGQLKQASADVFFTLYGVRGIGSSSRPPVSPGASRRSPTGQSRGDYSMPEIARCSN